MVLSLIPAAHASGLRWEKTDTEITAELSSRPVEQKETARQDPDEQIRVSIVPEQPSAVQAGYATMGIAANAEAMAYENTCQYAILKKEWYERDGNRKEMTGCCYTR